MTVDKRPCTNCRQNLATVKITRLQDGAVEEKFLCRQCAAADSPYQKKTLPQLDEILNGILGLAAAEAATVNKPVDLTCSTCGLPFGTYRQSLILGCSDCYESFEKLLINDLQRFHGAIRHTGRVPHSQAQEVQNFRSAEDFRKRLADAIRAEDFTLAARLRDQLKEVETANAGAGIGANDSGNAGR